MRAPHLQDIPSELPALHGYYVRGSLRILVGAGISRLSALPSWDELSIRLAEEYLKSRLNVELNKLIYGMVPGANLQELARTMMTATGREALPALLAVDRSTSTAQFPKLLSNALYNGRPEESLFVHDMQRQLAAMALQMHEAAKPQLLYTTNFDPMLELAIEELVRRASDRASQRPLDSLPSWREMVWPCPPKGQYVEANGRLPCVYHLHGFIDKQANVGGGIILGEADFQYLQDPDSHHEGSEPLERLFNASGAVLIIGMSLTDPHMRRQLYLLDRHRRAADSREVFALFRSHGSLLDSIVNASLLKNWGIQPVFVDEYWKMTPYLRMIQYGMDNEHRWYWHALDWSLRSLPRDVVYSDMWQRLAHHELNRLNQYIRKWHAVPMEEETHVALFSLVGPGDDLAATSAQRIYKVASTRRLMMASEAVAEAERLVAIVTRGHETSAAGLALSEGLFYDSAEAPNIINYKLSDDAEKLWNSHYGARDWRNLYVVPILAGERNLPVAVITISSTRTDPFWRRSPAHDGEERVRLRDFIRRDALWLLTRWKDGPQGSPIRFNRETSAPALESLVATLGD